MYMKFMKAIALPLVFLFVGVACSNGDYEGAESDAAAVYSATIAAVVDGDTVKISFDARVPSDCAAKETVRLIGVNTPEKYTDGGKLAKTPDYYAVEASAFTNQFWKRKVSVRFDTVSARRDKYGRLLAYITVDGQSVSLNQTLIAEGYGRYYGIFAFEPDKMAEFEKSEASAKKQKKGLWQ